MPEDNDKNQDLNVNETAAVYLGTRPRAALLDVEKDAPPSRFVLSPDKYTCGVPDMDKMTKEELDAVLEEGMADIRAGRVIPAEETWERLRKKYNLNI
jgi:hypothetical protein